ncbi:MAG: glycerophosphodiester phosphodiesterase [Propionibacteriaceae bacterium]|jgi:glycerophosphoryl diester phosphodiesterase|nr:glycerophosphodiester phosphodiesterase [Propionibacteriaceae bacterium]
MVKVWAHRGASGQSPENTLSAFRRAIELGADGIELDVHLTTDGQVVVMHDETVDRTTDGQGWIKDMSWAEFSQLNAAAAWPDHPAEPPPSLAQVLELIRPGPLEINIEIKDSVVPYPGLLDHVLSLVAAYGLESRVLISSFNHFTLACLRQEGSLVRSGVLFQDVLFAPWLYARRIWATSLHPNYLYADYVFDLVPQAHAAGLEVNVWTVDEPADIERMIGLGVDGVITNHPERALAIIAA